MMTTAFHFSEDERKRIDERIEHFFGFVQDVLDDPAILDDLPERATIELTPLREGTDVKDGVVRSRRFAISVVEPGPEDRRVQNA
jgi:hypothetical protein